MCLSSVHSQLPSILLLATSFLGPQETQELALFLKTKKDVEMVNLYGINGIDIRSHLKISQNF